MDLEARGLPNLASAVFNRYLERTGDLDALPVLPLFLSLRAAIRAHVSAAMAKGERHGRHGDDALAYLARAEAYLAPPPPRLLAIGGLSGSGKSRLAADLAPLLGASPGALSLRSDVLRKRLSGVDAETRLSADGYTDDMTERTYATLYDLAENALRFGHAVIADAVFARPAQRDAIEAVARRVGVPFDGIWLDAAPDVLRARVEARRNDASDATVAVLDQQLAYRLGAIGWRRQEASGSKEETFLSARQAMRI
jgi:predicted kinase